MFDFDNSYARLPERCYARLDPTPVARPVLVAFNRTLAGELGADEAALAPDEIAAVFSGNVVPAGAEPLAMAYAGHQFGNFVPQLGDGRALLLGEVIDTHGRRRDIQLKGSGITPFSRGGDGRAVRGDVEAVRALADHVIARHYPEVREAQAPYPALLEAVVERKAALVAHWMGVGFIHGVMNTDNTSISGETIDYGPCAFMDAYDPATVFSSIDRRGRYAFANQPGIAQWNLARLAETLLPLVDADPAKAVERLTPVVQGFAGQFERYRLDGMRRKLGLAGAEADDVALVQALLDAMQASGADYTCTFRHLADMAAGEGEAPEGLGDWTARWRARLARDPRAPAEQTAAMRAANPAVIPRNHHVEAALGAAVNEGNFAPFERLLAVLARPFEARPEAAPYMAPPAIRDPAYRTFCGT